MQAIILLSSGLDSSVSLALALEAGIEVKQALTFDYGQQASELEITRSKALAAHYQIPFESIQLPWLAKITQSALIKGSEQTIPTVKQAELDQIISVTLNSAKQVWVPNRNGLFINIAAAYADQFNYSLILMGLNAEEAATFPDNTPQFAQAATHSLAFSTRVQCQIKSEVQHLNKIEIFQEAIRLKVPLQHIWSCYRSGPKHCGLCESCNRLQRAAEASGHINKLDVLF